jgi:uncharacterized coiled-coil DUF342 family protein
MAKKDEVERLSNIDTAEVRDKLAELNAEIDKHEGQREVINSKINAARKSIKALGIDLDAWRASRRRAKMDPEDRDSFDRAAAVCNRAFGVPIQAELFDEPE